MAREAGLTLRRPQRDANCALAGPFQAEMWTQGEVNGVRAAMARTAPPRPSTPVPANSNTPAARPNKRAHYEPLQSDALFSSCARGTRPLAFGPDEQVQAQHTSVGCLCQSSKTQLNEVVKQ